MTAMAAPLSLSSRATISDHVLFHDLHGEAVLLDLHGGTYFGLDTIGTRIWHLLREQRSLREALSILVQEYDVTEHQGGEDLLDLVRQLEEHRLVEIRD